MQSSSFATLVQVGRHQAAARGEQVAFTFLGRGTTETARLTFGELDRRARAVASQLQRRLAPGDRALLVYPPGLGFIAGFFGCLYAGVVAVPAPLPRSRQLPSRWRAILADSRAAAVMTTEEVAAKDLLGELRCGGEERVVLATDTVADALAEDWQEPDLTPDRLAFLQYTSGSTGTPKGVMVSHRNLIANQQMLAAGFGTHDGSVIVSWLPLFHDMGLIGKVLHAHFVGVPCHLMAPMSFLKRPHLWLEAISRHRATLSGAPNFAFDLCVRRIAEEQAARLDLSSWEVAFNASEPVRAATLRNFGEKFRRCGFRPQAFYPCYGLAEATVMVSGGEKLAGPVLDRVAGASAEGAGGERVGCGRTVLDEEIRIVDPKSRTELPPGRVGEIWVAGPNVAEGYWERPAATAETFRARLGGVDSATSDPPSIPGPFLRTGDLGYLRQGELFITGRLKEVLIIRGRNHYPQDLEATVEACHPALRPHGGAAFSVDLDDEERAVVVHEVARNHFPVDFSKVFPAIRRALAEEHELDPHAIILIKAGSLAKTTSGKIQRRACRTAYLRQELPVVASWRAGERRREQPLAAIRPARRQLLALGPDERRHRLLKYLRLRLVYMLGMLPGRVDEGHALSALGLDSLGSIELVSALEDQLGVELPSSALLDDATPPQICDRILDRLAAGGAEDEGPAASAEADDGEGVALSHGQRSMWFLYKLAPASAAYHVAFTARIESVPDVAALERALGALVERHAALRTVFFEAAGEPRQRVLAPPGLRLARTEVRGWPEPALRDAVAAEIRRPFDLGRGPVFRSHLFTAGPAHHVLVLVAHHIAVDLWSIALLLDELRDLYSRESSGEPAAPLPALPEPRAGRLSAARPAPEYREFVAWQERLLAGPEGARQWSYWQERLAGELPTPELPTDYPRPPVQTFRGSAQPFRVDVAIARRIEALARSAGATLYQTLLAVFFALLGRYTGHRDVVAGTVATGRSRARFQRLVGYCANPVVLRVDLGGNPSFRELLARVRRRVLEGLGHQDLPFPLLVERLQPQRDPGRSPLFQVMFLLQKPHQVPEAAAFVLGQGDARMYLGGLMLSPFPAPQPVALFDLTMTLVPVGDELEGSLQYNTDLFTTTTVGRLVGHFAQLLAAVAANPEQPIAEAALLTPSERHQLLVEWNAMGWCSGQPRVSLHELFAAQAAATPKAVAVEFLGETLSYEELDRRANRLAHRLGRLGVGPGSLVAVCVERSPEMVAALVAVLKAGGAYVPLDPAYPPERLAFMAEDAAVAAVISEAGLLSRLPPAGAPVLCLPLSDEDGEPTEPPQVPAAAGHVGMGGGVPPCHKGGSRGDPRYLAYVLYTSGSTGRPKAVAITHGSAVALVEWAAQLFSPAELRGVLAATSLCFDLSIFELFVPLCLGGRVILARDALQLPELPAAGEVTLVNTVPSAMAELLRGGGLPASAATVNLAGEALPRELADRLYAGGTVVAVRNLYGPSEDTTYSTCALVARQGEPGRAPAIGRPIAGTRAYLLDPRLRPVPAGAVGELCLGGVGLARGYLNRPALTAAKFVPDPFTPGQRLYRTGDLARFRPDGSLDFLGRIDHQVKIRGFRIELGEIEALLGRHPAVVEVAAVAREEKADRRLVAYVVSSEALAAGDLREYLEAEVPAYMVPSAFVFLAALPRNPNGKLDRRRLPAPSSERPELGATLVVPRGRMEQTVAAIWRRALGLGAVGVDDNFFDLGGHSLLLAKVRSELERELGSEVAMIDLLRHPTIRSLARSLSGAPAEPSGRRPSRRRRRRRSPKSFPDQESANRSWSQPTQGALHEQTDLR